MFGKPKEFIAVGPLLEGLPVPTNTTIIVKLLSDGFKIQALTGQDKSNWKNFELSLEKVDNVQLFDERQIKQIVEQSVPGMILGAATFGLLGAMVGGRVKSKDTMTIKTLLVIGYQSDGQKQIILDVSNNKKDSERLVNYFKDLKPIQQQPIQL